MTAITDRSLQRPVSVPSADELETRSVLKKCVAAQAALADLRVAAWSFVNPALTTTIFSLLEAKDSCQIANVVTTIDALFRASNGLKVDDGGAAHQVLRYRSALLAAVASPEPLSVATASRLAHALAPQTIPPLIPLSSQRDLAERLATWTKLLNQTDSLEPLVHWAVTHYLFVAAQPFALATGPAGRILNLLSLMNSGALDLPVLYLSRHLLETKADYDRRLSALTQTGDWQPFLDYMLTALEQSAMWSTGKLRATHTLMDMAAAHIRNHAPKIYSPELTELIFAEPYTRVAHLVNAGIAKRQTAAVYLKQLSAIGILKEQKVGRDKIFVHRKYLYLLTRDENAVTAYPAPVLANS